MLSLLAAVALLLPLLAVLQYRWLGQVSTAERERMGAVLRSAAAQFGETFDREITRAYSTFQQRRAGEISQLAKEYAGRFQEWDTSASYPRMVRDLYLIVADAQGSNRLLQFEQGAAAFHQIDWPEELAELQGVTMPTDPIRDEIPALLIPSDAADEGASRILCVVVVLDLDHLKQVVIPALATRFFAADDELEYELAIVRRSDPQAVVFQTNDNLASRATNDAVTGLFEVRLETLLGRPEAQERKGLVRIVKRQRISTGEEELPGRWKLLVRHQSGSLEEAVANGRRRNLAVSFGVLLLLALSVGFIVVSSGRATRLAREQMKFVAGVSHELRTPLAVICSAGENLADGVVHDRHQIAEYGSLIRNEGRRLSRMVEQVLEYAGAQPGRQPYQLKPVALRAVVEAALNESRLQLEEGGFKVETEIETDLPLVNADAAALQRALQNLLGNAIKYGAENRWIALRARKDSSAAGSEEVTLTVEDRGRGIPARDVSRIFEPFYRSPDVVAAQIQGSGLGLSLVQHIAAAHGGRVSVESRPGQGSSFTIHLPIAAPTAS